MTWSKRMKLAQDTAMEILCLELSNKYVQNKVLSHEILRYETRTMKNGHSEVKLLKWLAVSLSLI